MPIKTTADVAYTALLNAADAVALQQALQEHFAPAGSDLECTQPVDMACGECAITKLSDAGTKQLASRVHALWPLLCRKVRFADILVYLSNRCVHCFMRGANIVELTV